MSPEEKEEIVVKMYSLFVNYSEGQSWDGLGDCIIKGENPCRSTGILR